METMDASVPLWHQDFGAVEEEESYVPGFGEIMTLEELESELLNDEFGDWHLTSPIERLDAPKTPSRCGQQPSASPSSRNAQFTPSSTTPSDWANGTGSNQAEDGSCVEDASAYTTSPIEGYENISLFASRSSDYSEMSQAPQPKSEQASSRRSRDSSAAPPEIASHSQWTSFATTTTMDDQHFGQAGDPSQFSFDSNGFSATVPYNDSILAGMTANPGQAYPFRPAQAQDMWPIDYPDQQYTIAQAPQTPTASWGSIQPYAPQTFMPPAMTAPTMHSAFPHAVHHQDVLAAYQYSHDPATQRFRIEQHRQAMQARQGVSQHAFAGPMVHGQAQPVASQYQVVNPPITQQGTVYGSTPAFSQNAGTGSRQGHRILAVAGPSGAPARHSDIKTIIKGGRKKHSHLNEQARQKSSAMRKTGACWRCAMQRDQCDGGDPCNRCLMRWQKGQQYFFDCDRSKLPDFVLDFLPPSMTLMHQKQTIEDCVQEQVIGWDFHRPVDVYLTTGYGHALRWKLYEFKPSSRELLGQYQYMQDVATGRSMRQEKYSPPLGITKLETSDDTHFQTYLDELLHEEHLRDFPWTCFEEETQINDFQATTLALMCNLYERTHDYDLRELLRKIIRMMIITYIMGHTLTISEDTLQSVLGFIRHSEKPNRPQRRTSPRLANRQLKFFFAAMRQQIYEDILKWQQATLHTSGHKEQTWLSSFCVMLGLAMVLEEVQRVIQIQADTKTQKREKTNEEAQQEAANACERIDARYKLLVGLFQCKYRDKKWTGTGSFGNSTPKLEDPIEVEFLHELHKLLVEREQHLRSRRDVIFSSENQCQYTSRLVARFLLPFLGLPEN